jgi:antitoxin Phd
MIWEIQEAAARLNDLLDACLRDGPQIISRDGKEEAIFLSIAEWKRNKPNDLKSILLASTPIVEDMPFPKRGSYRHRKPPVF